MIGFILFLITVIVSQYLIVSVVVRREISKHKIEEIRRRIIILENNNDRFLPFSEFVERATTIARCEISKALKNKKTRMKVNLPKVSKKDK